MRRRDPEDQARYRDDAVVRAENARPQPAQAFQFVAFMTASAHGNILDILTGIMLRGPPLCRSGRPNAPIGSLPHWRRAPTEVLCENNNSYRRPAEPPQPEPHQE